jgi:hypothetical protein
MWPTARAEDSESCGNDPDAADTWRTPDSPGSGGPRNRQDSMNEGHQVTIAEQAEHWQTPNARDWKSETGSENNSYDKPPNLSRQVYRLSRQDQPIPDGPTSSPTGRTSLQRLNPRFVEWLMGFPIGWTELCETAPNVSEDSAMQSSPTAQSGSAGKSSRSKRTKKGE